jgi:hypothetical protein
VEYEEDNAIVVNEDKDNDEDANPNEPMNYNFDEELNKEEAYDQIDQDEIDEILAEPGQHNESINPLDRDEQDLAQDIEPPSDHAVTDNEDDNTMTTESSRPSRERKEPDRITFNQH